jgi:RHS repeat-associated protein
MRYTTDGSIPHTGSLPNGALINGTSGYVTIQANTVKTLKAIAFGAGYQDSTVTSAVFDRVDHTTTCVPPTFNPYGQSQGQHPPVAVPVTISTTTTGASISYTLSSSSNDIPTPTHGTIVNATSTTAWIGINNFWYLKAIAFKSGSYNSSVTSSTYDNTDPGGGNSPVQGDDKLSGHGSRGQRQLNQLDSVRSVNYTLDNCGNRTQVVDAGMTKNYTPNNLNQYSTGHGMTVTNGPSHEISAFNGTNYSYIADSYLVKASTVTGNNSYTLFYDALGRCVKRTSVTNGGTPVDNYYIFDGEHWVVEYDANGAIQSNALYGIGMDEVIARGTSLNTSSPQGWFYFPDRNGNISVVTDGVNTVRESYRYDAFGAPTVTVPVGQTAINNRFLFTRREWNAIYGFYEYRARAYNPTLGRFTSEDPKGFDAGDYNLYRYCNNDPMDLNDPMGLEFKDSDPEYVGTLPGQFGRTTFSLGVGVDVVPSPNGGFDVKVSKYNVKVVHKPIATATKDHGDRSKDAIRATLEHENKHVSDIKKVHDENQGKAMGHFETKKAAEADKSAAVKQLTHEFDKAEKKTNEHKPTSEWKPIMDREKEGR